MWKKTENIIIYRIFGQSQNVCIDERMVGHNGSDSIVQYLPTKKNHRWGIKCFVLADATNGYTSKIDVFKGKR